MNDDGVSELVITAVRRATTLRALQSSPLTRSELQAEIGVSRTTTHRIVRGLRNDSLVERTNGRYELIPLGRVVAGEVERLKTTIEVAVRLEPVLPSLDETDLDIELLTDATITVPEAGDPYGPVRRFVTLLSDSETLRGFDTTSIAPMYVDEIRDNILDGMQTEIVYLPEVIEQILMNYRESIDDAVESGQLELLVHDDLPFGLSLFDDRVGIGGYDDMGVLRVFADTDDSDVREWAESLYEQYHAEATPFREHSDLLH
ncbi:helix-turn-helix transcriptional regulator [Haladaptatus sp. NG-SE-30]